MTSKDFRSFKKNNSLLQHYWFNYVKSITIYKLNENALKIKLIKFKTIKYPHYTVAKIKKQIAKKTPTRERLSLKREIYIN